MTFWFKIVKVLKSTTTWTRAVRLFEAGRHDDALLALDAHFEVYQVSPPSVQAPIRSNVLLATLAFWASKPDLVRDSILTVVSQVRSGRTPYNQDTTGYIVRYCEYLNRLAVDHYGGAYVPVGDFPDSTASIDEANLRPDIRRIFPLE